MFRYLTKHKIALLFILLCIVIEPSINSWMNFWLQDIFNYTSTNASAMTMIRMITIGFLIWLLKRVLLFSCDMVKSRIICDVRDDIKHDLFLRIFRLDVSKVSGKVNSGEYISTFSNDIQLIEQRYFQGIIGLISNIAAVIILGSSFLLLNKKLAIAILLFSIVVLFVPMLFSSKLSKDSGNYSRKNAEFMQSVKDYFLAYPTIKNYAIEKQSVCEFDDINSQTENAKFQSDFSLLLANNVGSMLSWFMQLISVGLGIMMVINGEILVGTVIAARSFASELATPLQGIVWDFNSIRSVREIVAKMKDISSSNDILADVSDADNSQHDNQISACYIEFEDVSLSLNENDIIRNFSYSFEHGKKYLIIGKNGSGKSSIFKILKKRFKNYSGTVRICGCDIKHMTNGDISRNVSYMNENVSMFAHSIRDNIIMNRNIDNRSFTASVDAVHLDIDIDRVLTDAGGNISSGEQRKIEIARSLAVSVPVLIFDEVVSTLDIETAYELEKTALELPEKTVIFISHNFSGKLLKCYDEILLMDNGKLVAHDSFERLIASNDYFRHICEIKFGGSYEKQ